MVQALKIQRGQAQPGSRLLLGVSALLLLLSVACKGGEQVDRKPTGSPTDPVEVCERPAQVCQYKGSQLGVCISKQKSDPTCEGKYPCFVCVPQH